MDRLLHISIHQGAVEYVLQATLFLLISSCDAAFSVNPFYHCIPNQACVETPIPEVQPAVNYIPDLPGLAGDQCLSKDNMGEDERSLRVPPQFGYHLPLHSNYCSELTPQLTGGGGIPSI